MLLLNRMDRDKMGLNLNHSYGDFVLGLNIQKYLSQEHTREVYEEATFTNVSHYFHKEEVNVWCDTDGVINRINKMRQKIISIFIAIFTYLSISEIFHALFQGKRDIALGILYTYSDIYYVVGFTLTFLFWGKNRISRCIFAFLSSIFLIYYVYSWIKIDDLPYERYLYIILGLMTYLCEYYHMKNCDYQ